MGDPRFELGDSKFHVTDRGFLLLQKKGSEEEQFHMDLESKKYLERRKTARTTL